MRIFAGSVVGAIILMVWGMFYWIASGIPEQQLHHLENEEEVVAVLQKNISESGRYLLPWFDTEKELSADEEVKLMEKLFEKHKKGPLVTIIYRKDGTNPMDPSVYAQGFFHFFICCLLVCFMLHMTSFESYGKRFFFIFLIGLFASIYLDFSDPIWFHYPWSYHISMAFFHIFGWFLNALALAAIVKRKAE